MSVIIPICGDIKNGGSVMRLENGHKIKLLKLMELFRQETDENHPMLATAVCKTAKENTK